MPSFEIEFEVYCGTCGAHLCGNTQARMSRNRHCPQITVDVCDRCLDNAREELRRELEQEHEAEIARLKEDHADEIRMLEETT
jgi:hypothetical protein